MDKERHAKQFCLLDYDCFGFDLDGCLLKYQWDKFFKYLHSYVVSHLKNGKGYDSCLFKPYEQSWKDIMFRSIIVDTQRGNVLKVLGCGLIKRAFHGSRSLSADEIHKTYQDGKLPVLFELLQNFNHTQEFHLVDNYFEGPLVMLYLDLVDAADKKEVIIDKSYQELWDDIFGIYIRFFQNDSTESSGRFIDLTQSPESCCVTLSPEMRKWLQRLKSDNRTVFLMTSSLMHFSEPMLKFLLGPDAVDYFDFFIGKAGKPIFFYRDLGFFDMEKLERNVPKFHPKQWYCEGNHQQLMDLLKDFSGKDNPKVLYFGDGLKNDVFPSKVFAKWGTVLVLEGLEAASEKSCLESQKNNSQIKQVVADEDVMYVSTNPVWGSFFEDEGAETLFARVISETADLTVPWLDYIADLPIDQRFPSKGENTYEGYYPPLKATKAS